ncbi:MAG: hypothetical protein U0521_28160 [Anaerolineae bacterium]
MTATAAKMLSVRTISAPTSRAAVPPRPPAGAQAARSQQQVDGSDQQQQGKQNQLDQQRARP